MVTLQNIADKTGFSLSVVSRALNPKPDQKVKADTQKIIQAAVEELGYRRNHTASRLARGKSTAVGVFLPNYSYSLLTDLIVGITEAADNYDFQYNFYFGLNNEDYRQFFDSLKTIGSSGILSYLPDWNGGHESLYNMTEEYLKHGGKMLLLNSAELPELGVHSMNIDNNYGGRLAAEHLYRQKCEEYICLSSPNSWQSEQRYAGFMEFLRKHNKECQIHYIDSSDFQHYDEAKLEKLVKGSQTRRIGFFAFSDYLAMDLMRTLCRLDYGKIIGKNIKIIGYDNIAASSHTYPPLTTISQPFRELGNCGMQKLLNMISGTDNNLFKMPNPKLVVRESA